MDQRPEYVELFNRNLHAFFKEALRISLKDPAMAFFLYQTLRRQRQATRTREEWERQGVHVPAFMIASVTKRCNLRCTGCYAHAQHRTGAEMSADKLRSVLAEARDLGVSIVLIAGGEPLTRPEILDIAAAYPEIIFPLFTNGLLLDEPTVARLETLRNVVPVLSIEGHAKETDARRGSGVYAHLHHAMTLLREHRVFFGTSITVTGLNMDTVLQRSFVEELMSAGSRLFFFVDYVPVQEGTEVLCLNDEQRAQQAEILSAFRSTLPGLFVAFPGDEEMYGGCLAAGRGFVHISPDGRLEPCPFSPFSDVSLNDMPLRDALRSPLLRTIRESDAHLRETRGGCALWEQRDWVGSLLQTSEMVR